MVSGKSLLLLLIRGGLHAHLKGIVLLSIETHGQVGAQSFYQ